jgi:DNA polymerase
MADAFTQLLDAAIADLERRHGQGARFVRLTPEARQWLQTPSAAKAAHSPGPAAPVSSAAPLPRRAAPAIAAPRPAAARAPAAGAISPEAQGMLPAKLAPAALEQAMAELRQRAMSCIRCPNLAAARRNVVFGVGDVHSPLMFIGEAPGLDEDERGEPFVGKAGQLLTKIIETMGLSRERVYIANILKCRPDTPGQAYGNRKPTADEMNTCKPYVLEQIDLIQPRVIVALGATAVEGLLGTTTGITRLRGNWQSFRGIPVMPTYHPAYLLRNQAISEKRKVWEDMLAVMERLGMEISEKQRRFFAKG